MAAAMKGAITALYSAVAYLVSMGVFLYAVGFIEGIVVPKTLDSGPAGDPAGAAAIDLGLLALFAVQHSVMARTGFKRAWTRLVPEAAERSTYLLFTSLVLALLIWCWRPLPGAVWSLGGGLAVFTFAMSWAGWALALASTFLISHVHLFGLSQGFGRLFGREASEPQFATPPLYRWMRHPLYAGMILAFWAAPRMSVGHLIFAAAMTGYILVGIRLEERDLAARFGQPYLRYRAQVGMLVPRLGPRSPRTAPSRGTARRS